MKLRDIMKLPELSGFKLISGSGGLDKYVDATEIIDFEFAEGIEFTREEMFYGHSVGITSLMFARQKPELILDAVKQLDGMGVACLCYKPIFFKELPEEVIEYSEDHDFPIFEITDDAFFEDIVMAIKKEVGQDMTESEIEGALEALIVDELSDKDAERLRNRILPAMRKNVGVMCFAPGAGHEEDFDRDHLVRYSRRIALNQRFGDRVAIVRFRQGGFLVLSRDEGGIGDMEALLTDAIIASGLPEEKALWGKSRVLRRETSFAQAVKEAYWALRVCQIEGAHTRGYDEIGIYRLIAPEMESKT
ncbi:MAG: PucR family transcriptional regulator ligand-binding domain-containing protein, partial [Firmicutes bacterium]|nr:PucR family transcriptional regulator ligand-binding domain-containing protein [Bacillota bacterium]